MPASKVQQAITAQRRTELVRLAAAGKSMQDIADELGYSSRSAASKDLCRVLELSKEEERYETSTYRELLLARLDMLLDALWPQAMAGDPRAAEAVLRIEDRRAKLTGSDAPVRTEMSGPGGGAIPLGPVTGAELRHLIQAAGDPDDEDDDPDDGDADDGEDDLA